jgi:hypothetical protein
MDVIRVNGFEIDYLFNARRFSGYFTRDCDVLVTYSDDTCEKTTRLMSNKFVNSTILRKINMSNNNDSVLLENCKAKIEEPSEYIKDIGKNLIEDYNWKYLTIQSTNIEMYMDTPKMCLIRLEQFFILNGLPACYIFEFVKPDKNSKDNLDLFKMIKGITKFDVMKIRKLKEYLDEYLQYVFDLPKNMYKINKLVLPLDCIHEVTVEQLAAYFTRTSNVLLELIDSSVPILTNNKEANKSFMLWINAIFGSDSFESKKLSEYRSKIENPTEEIESLNKKLSLNQKQSQCLIDIEQLIIRHNLDTNIINDYTNNYCNIINSEIFDLIKEITNLKGKKITNLVKYLDSYLEYTIQRTKNK